MDVSEVYLELYGRIGPLAERAVKGLTPDQLHQAPGPGANPIGWLIWHLARVQDHHIAEILDASQVWVDDDRARRFGLEPDPANIGYGHRAEEVEMVRPEGPRVLLEYLSAVEARTTPLLRGLSVEDLDRVVDRRWDPAVTLGVRLVSVADDSLQHVGQANYVRGLFGW